MSWAVWRTLFVALGLSFIPSITRADVFRPAYLELKQRDHDVYEVFWKVPALGDSLRMRIRVRFPVGTTNLSEPRGSFVPGAFIERWSIRRNGGLAGSEISIDGLPGSVTDVLARVEKLDGTTQVARLRPERPRFLVAALEDHSSVARTYTKLGVRHILTGVDHLLYVLAMLFLVQGWRRILATLTAFTATHSLTLTAAALGWVHVPGPPIEACIALSIVFVAREIVQARNGQPGLTARYPWLVSFTFGLLHGFGFAGALAEVGLPVRAIPTALLCFNIGVELGQIAFVATALLVFSVSKRIPLRRPAWARLAPGYAIGTVAMFWLVERVLAFKR